MQRTDKKELMSEVDSNSMFVHAFDYFTQAPYIDLSFLPYQEHKLIYLFLQQQEHKLNSISVS